LLRRPGEEVVVFDNLISGQEAYLEDVRNDPRLELVVDEIQDLDAVVEAMKGSTHVYLFAANPDIAKAMTEPPIDFWQGTYLTQNVIEAMRVNGVPRITYASGSGVYGDRGLEEVDENFGPLVPISTYGASKLGCEALLAAYSHMFGIDAVAFRFANVVGPRQTHGVTYDFVRRLLRDPTRLQILGDGSQSKSYIHVSDVVSAMLLLTEQGWSGFDVFNAGTGDYITVKEIADLVVGRMNLNQVEYEFSGGSRGWKGDVPVVRFRSEKLASRGWVCGHSSRSALIESIDANIAEASAELQTQVSADS
jgi:UDP-glucose 4-epimerase